MREKSMDQLKVLFKQYKHALIKAWVYDTRLELDESYNAKKLAKSKELFNEANEIERQINLLVETISC